MITFGFELDILQRKRPYRWTIWVSSLQLWGINTSSMKVALSRNPLHALTCLHSFFNRYRRPQGSLSREARPVLGLGWRSLLTFLFNIAIRDSELCKCAAPVFHSFHRKRDFKSVRHCPMQVGHSLLLLLFSACMSFLGIGRLTILIILFLF